MRRISPCSRPQVLRELYVACLSEPRAADAERGASSFLGARALAAEYLRDAAGDVETAVARLLRGPTRRITLDDEQFAQVWIALLAVGQLSR